MNRNLYILDKATRTFTLYINFEEVFPTFDSHRLEGGLITFAFHPDHAQNGTFYTVHTEDNGSAVPTNTSLPGLDLSSGYTTTTAINPPAGTVARHAVLVEWTDTNRNNSTFEGTAREILRVGFNTNIHPIGDLLFNPLAQPGDADDGNLYISVGDGGAGETAGATQTIPQRLDAVQGKILRITPDITLRPADELSSHGRYRIPTTGSDPNPFVSLSLTDLKKEIFAYGFRNPQRMNWDLVSNKLIVNDIGLHAWEEVNIVTKGTNYGYAEREGIEQLLVGGTNNGKTGSQTNPPTPFPDPDSLTVTGIVTPVMPVYPVAQYSHQDGDAISSGFVYRGSLIPELYGKYIFGDITTARLVYADLADMIAKDDGNRTSLAAVHELQVVFDRPSDNPDQGPVNRRLFDIVADEYARKGGDAAGSAVLPGGATPPSNDPDGIPYGGGRADIRLALGGDGEIYVLSKSDGMIRQLVAVVALPPPSELTTFALNGGATSTTSPVVALNNTATGNPTEYQASESSSFAGATWQLYAAAPSFTLSSGNGVKRVYLRVRDAAGAVSVARNDTITLNQPVPVVGTFALNGGATSTTSPVVTLNNTATGSPTEYQASESSSFAGATWQLYAAAPSFTLSSGNGVKRVYLRVRDAAGAVSVARNDTITLNQPVPVVGTFALNGGATSTTSPVVTLNNTATGSPTEYQASEGSSFAGATWQPYAAAPSFTLSSGNGVKRVYLRVRNAAGAVSVARNDTITLNQPVPVVGTFALNGGATSTTSPVVTLNNTATGSPTEYQASEGSNFVGATWQPYAAAPSFTLSSGNGVKRVYFRVRNAAGAVSVVRNDTITLSQ